jgi:hypothetical protein
MLRVAGRRRRVAALSTLLMTAIAALIFQANPEPAVWSGLAAFTVPSNTTGDPTTAIRLIAARHDHGSADDNLPEPEIAVIAKVRIVRLTCSYVAGWAVTTLRAAGYQARVVATFNDATNEGHTLIEAMTPGGWVLYDVDLDVWFWQNGHPMSFIDFDAAVRTGEPYEIRPLSGTHPVPPDLKGRYRTAILVPMVRKNGIFWFFARYESRSRTVQDHAADYHPLPERLWLATFYPRRSAAPFQAG